MLRLSCVRTCETKSPASAEQGQAGSGSLTHWRWVTPNADGHAPVRLIQPLWAEKRTDQGMSFA